MCTGYGGLDLAIAAVLAIEHAWVADPDPGAAAILAHRFPDVPNLGDITALDWTTVPRVDILAAGFPCQDISYAGRGAGIRKGTRSGLWHTIADAVSVLRPGLVVLENVRAIVTRRPGLDVVLGDLARLGFDADWTCLRASNIGAPHRRERWFLAAYPNRERDDRAATEHRTDRRPLAATGALADAQGARREGTSDQQGRARGRAAAHSNGLSSGHHRELPAGRHPVQQRLRDDAAGRSEAAAHAQSDGRNEGRPEPARLVRRSNAALGGGPDVDWGDYAPAVDRWTRILGRPAPNPTEPGRDGKPRLNPVFVEWMQGLDHGHVTAVPSLTRNQQLKALGNGVVPQQGAFAIAHLLDRMETQ
jgi:DNA (cytosine-5)-methyltransferase 1